MSNDDLEQLKQRIVELTYCLEQLECRSWEMTKLAFDAIQPAPDPTDYALTDAGRVTLTALEREAITEAIQAFDEFSGDEIYVASLRALLARAGGQT